MNNIITTAEEVDRKINDRIKIKDFIVSCIRNENYDIVTDDDSHSEVLYFADRHHLENVFHDYNPLVNLVEKMLGSAILFARYEDTLPTFDEFINGKSFFAKGMKYSDVCNDCMKRMHLSFKKVHDKEQVEIKFHYEGKCENNRDFTVDVSFPSGRIVFSDWPKYFNAFEEKGLIVKPDHDVNYAKGVRETTEKFAEQNIAHFFVGNTCPSLMYDEQMGSLDIFVGGESNIVGAKNLGMFITDLWWATIMDAKEYERMIAELGEDAKENWHEDYFTEIEPGTYRFRPLYTNTVKPFEEGIYVRGQRYQ